MCATVPRDYAIKGGEWDEHSLTHWGPIRALIRSTWIATNYILSFLQIKLIKNVIYVYYIYTFLPTSNLPFNSSHASNLATLPLKFITSLNARLSTQMPINP